MEVQAATSFIDTVKRMPYHQAATDASGPTTKRTLKIDFVVNENWDHFDSHALRPEQIAANFGLWTRHAYLRPNQAEHGGPSIGLAGRANQSRIATD